MLIYVSLAIAILIAIAYWKPAFAVSYILCIYGAKQLLCTQSSWFVANHQIFYIVGGVLCLTAIYSQHTRKQLKTQSLRTGVHSMYIMLYVWSFLSILWSVSQEDSIERWKSLAPHVIVAIALAPLTVQTRSDLEDLLHGLVILGTPLIIATFLVGTFGYRTLQIQTPELVSGRINNPLMLARFAAIVAAGAFFTVLPKGIKLLELGRYVLLGTCAYLMVKAGARGEFLGLVVAIAIISMLSTRLQVNSKTLLTIAGTVAGIGTLYYVLESQTQFAGRWSAQEIEESTQVRMRLALLLMNAWASNPLAWLLGLGSSASFSQSIIGVYCHNVPVEVLGELGFVGLSIFLIALFNTVRIGSHVLRSKHFTPAQYAACQFLAAISIVGFIVSLKAGALLGSQEIFMSHILVATIPFLATTSQRQRRYPAVRTPVDHRASFLRT